MATARITLPDELKARIERVADGSVAEFVCEALRQAVEQAEKRAAFVADALAARDDMDRTGLGYDADDVHAYMRARAAGLKPKHPRLKRWRG